jgi:hypothetical protein
MDIHEVIAKYEEALRDRDEMERIYNEQRASILSAVQPDLDALEIEMRPYLNAYAEQTTQLEVEARRLVLDLHETVDGSQVQLVYVKGKTTWDGQKLQGMASLIPQLKEAMKVGDPSVSIRSKK